MWGKVLASDGVSWGHSLFFLFSSPSISEVPICLSPLFNEKNYRQPYINKYQPLGGIDTKHSIRYKIECTLQCTHTSST